MTAKHAIFLRVGLAILLAPTCINADAPVEAPIEPAQENVDTSLWMCVLCPYRFGWWGEIDIGAGWVSESSNRFGDYRGLNDRGAFLALDGQAHYRSDDGRYFDMVASDLGIDSRRVRARTGKHGRYTLELSYREIPRYRGSGSQTPFLGVGSSELTLPASWQTAPVTSAMTSLASSLQPLDLRSTRKIFDAALAWQLGNNWSWEAEYQHQSRNGTRPFGAGVFTLDASHVPAPVDFSTDRVVLGLNFNGGRGHWRLGFMGSRFNNHHDSFTWQNPFQPLPGNEVLRASLAPDNEAYRFDLAGTWAHGSRLRLSGSASFGHMGQDEPLLPYSINPAFSDVPLPRLTADARINARTIDLSGRLSARLSRNLNLDARLQHDERDNRTPVDTWTPVITDFLLREPRPNRPYSFERQRASLSVRYRPRSSFGLQAGVNRDDMERTLQSVEKTEEGGWFLQASFNLGSIAGLRARFERTDRDGQPYLQVPDYALPEHPLMRKFNLADRDRERLNLDLDFYPLSDVTVNLSYRLNEDRFSDSVLGLRASDGQSLSLDLGWNLSANFSTHAFVSQDTYDAVLAGMEPGATSPWVTNSKDTFLTAGVGLNLQLGQHTELVFDLVSSKADGDIHTDSGAGERPFPTLETDLFNARLSLDRRINRHWGLKLLVEHERYDSTDWALDGLGADGIPAVLTFGAESPDYDVTVVRVQASFTF